MKVKQIFSFIYYLDRLYFCWNGDFSCMFALIFKYFYNVVKLNVQFEC